MAQFSRINYKLKCSIYEKEDNNEKYKRKNE